MDYIDARRVKRFQMLKPFDSSNDGRLTNEDNEFLNLMIWRDLNIDGKFDLNEAYTLDQLGITSLLLRSSNFRTSEGWLTQESNTQLLRKGRYTHDAERALKPVRDMAGGKIYMTSFEINLTSYTSSSGQSVIDTTGKVVDVKLRPVDARLTQTIEPPALRLR